MTVYAEPVRRPGPSAGWWGMVAFVAAEAMLFACLIGTYLYLRFKSAVWPPQGIPEPKVALPLVLTGILLLTSAPMQLAAVAARRGRVGRTRALILLALVVQAAYFGVQVHEYAGDLGSFGPQANAYGSIYYVLLGADHAHVFVGLLFDVWLLLKLLGGLTTYRLRAVGAIAFYWHAVNVITLAVVATELSARL
jgi:heme/copper-type cytochrome/quinol oxidase subunit 3